MVRLPRGTNLYDRICPYTQRFLSDFLIRIEIGVEAAERGSGAARNRANRRFVKAALAEFDRRRVEQLAQRPPSALGARGLVARFARAFSRFGPRLIHGCLSVPPSYRLRLHRGISAPLASKKRQSHIPS